jgi:cytidine deaminase
MPIDEPRLLAMMAAARDQLNRAYAPYSEFKVGAAVLGGSGRVYLGCNVENASYGLSVCAERVAIFKAISEGETEIRAVVVCVDGDQPARPCGACLQVMAEFSPRDEPTTIVTCSPDGTCARATLTDYLPMPFVL